MIQVTLSFNNISEAHAALGGMMAQGIQPVHVAPAAPSEPPAVTSASSDAMEAGAVAQAAAELKPKPKTKRTGRPKGSKDGPGVVRKGTKKAGEGLTIEEVQSKLAEYANEHGFKAARDVLTKHNVKRVSELPQDRWFKLMGDLNQAPKEEEQTS